jgi:cell division protein FtsW
MVKSSRGLDFILIATTGLLITFGIIVLASASTSVPEEKFGSIYHLFNHQLLLALLPGILLAIVFLKFPLNLLKKKAPILLLLSLLLMIIVFLPQIGIKSGEAARWINLGFFSLQPSEPLKLTFILYLASWLESRSKKKSLSKSPKKIEESLIAFLVIIILITILLILQSDVSTLGVIVVTATLMYFFANTPFWHTLFIVIMGIAILFVSVKVAPYRLERIAVFFNPKIDPMGISYQLKQALIAVGSGKIFGVGLGMSQQKFGILPHPMSDSIFAILAEEMGFLGSVFLISLFLLFLWRGFKIGKESSDMFSQLTALGITSWILIQVFISISSMIGLTPMTGIPLPFISYGGSALITELAAVGILLNISKK